MGAKFKKVGHGELPVPVVGRLSEKAIPVSSCSWEGVEKDTLVSTVVGCVTGRSEECSAASASSRPLSSLWAAPEVCCGLGAGFRVWGCINNPQMPVPAGIMVVTARKILNQLFGLCFGIACNFSRSLSSFSVLLCAKY